MEFVDGFFGWLIGFVRVPEVDNDIYIYDDMYIFCIDLYEHIHSS